jgi:nicotinamidase-related amidase
MDAATALIVVDVQQAFDDADTGVRRNNPGCEANVARLIEAWRRGAAAVFVRHDSDEEDLAAAPRTSPATRSSPR